MGKLLREALQNWPAGTVAVQSWLERQQVARQLSQKYLKSGWLQKIGQGAYIKVGDQVDWRGGVYALQHELQMPVHVGGKSALELLGQTHFIPVGGQRRIALYTHGQHPERYLPKWFVEYFKKPAFDYIPKVLFNADAGKLGLSLLNCATFQINLSTVERALLEVLALVPKITFGYAYLLMEDKESLRPSLIQELLESCRSQTVKRLFLYLAKKCRLSWYEELNIQAFNLGQDKRTIGSGEHYDSEFKLFVPKLETNEQQGYFE